MDKDYLIEKWLKDELTDAERQAFDQLDDAKLNTYIIENAKHFKASNFSEVDNFKTFKAHYNSQKTNYKKSNWLSPLLKIASVIIITLGLYFTFFSNSLTHIETQVSEKTFIELPDASQVELNALSTIEFDYKNWKDNRTVKLDGEAYFKVTKGKTFDVKTKQGIVTVVGTQFNVKQRDNYFEVICFEGIVKVTSNAVTRQLLAGDTYQVLNGNFSERKTNATSPKWIESMSDFEAIPFEQVLAELERQYDVQVTFKNIDTTRLFTGGFAHDNLENALIAITEPMNMTYELNTSNLVVIHGKDN